MFVITQDDPLYVVRFFETFLPAVPDTIKVVGMTVCRAFHEPLLQTATRMFRFYGLADFARLCLRFAKAKLSRRSIRRLATDAPIPLIETRSINDAQYLRRVERLAPDVIVSVAAPEIFGTGLLSLPALGCVNVHSGRLPAYRGMMPTFWQLLAGEASGAVTVHEMVERVDMGRILGVREFPLHERDSLHRVITGTKRAAAGLVLDVLDLIRTGRATPRDSDPSDVGYHSFPRPGDVRAFRKRGHRML